MSYLKLRAGEKDRPGIFKTKAEKGFIYGLPIAMNYAVMYADALDRDSADLFNAKAQTLSWRGVSQKALSRMAIKTSGPVGPVVPLKPTKPIRTVTPRTDPLGRE